MYWRGEGICMYEGRMIMCMTVHAFGMWCVYGVGGLYILEEGKGYMYE
jgi:hypothetical protein